METNSKYTGHKKKQEKTWQIGNERKEGRKVKLTTIDQKKKKNKTIELPSGSIYTELLTLVVVSTIPYSIC